MKNFYSLVALLLLCVFSLSAQPIIITASIGLVEDQCTGANPDPNADCVNVPVSSNSLTYLPGEDGDYIVTYRFKNNSASATINSVSVTDNKHGVVIPVTAVSIAPGQTVTTNRIYPATTNPGTFVITVTANAETTTGGSSSAMGQYTLDVAAPEMTTQMSVVRKADVCPEVSIAAECMRDYTSQSVEVGALDTVVVGMELRNTGIATIDEMEVLNQDGELIASTGFDHTTGLTLIANGFVIAPAGVGTYNYSWTYTGTDFGGNEVVVTEPFTVTVVAPEMTTQMSVVRKADVCPEVSIAAECMRDYTSQSVEVGALDTVVVGMELRNTGIVTIDEMEVLNQDGELIASTGFDHTTGLTLIANGFVIAPAGVGTYNYSWTYTGTDFGGNEVEVTEPFTVIVSCAVGDLAAPTALCRDRTFTITESETANINIADIDDGSFDNCGGSLNGDLSQSAFDCSDEGENVITLTVMDESGNTAACTATVTIDVTNAIATGIIDQCITGTASLDGVGSQEWVPIYSPNGRLMAEVRIAGNNLTEVVVEMYRISNIITSVNGLPVLGKQVAIHFEDENGVEIQPDTDPVYVRLYYTEQEVNALVNSLEGSSVNTFSLIKTDDACGAAYTGSNALDMNTSAYSVGCSGDDYYLEFFTGTFSSFFLFPSQSILPVTFINFVAKAAGEQSVILGWTTGNEINNSHFEVEHSKDGKSFTAIGEVAGAGNSNDVQAYQFIHNEAQGGVNYYRLKQVDFDGQSAYSLIVQVSLDPLRTNWVVYPNPIINGEVRLRNWPGGEVFLTDTYSRIINQQWLDRGAVLQLGDLPAGIYFLLGGRQTEKIVVKH